MKKESGRNKEFWMKTYEPLSQGLVVSAAYATQHQKNKQPNQKVARRLK